MKLKETEPGAAPMAESARLEASRSRGGAARTAGALAAAAAVLLGGAYYLRGRHLESTDDAAIEGHVTALSPNVAGTVVKVHVADNQQVRSGELLVEIDPKPFEVRLGQDKADVAAAQADARRAQLDLERYRQLLKEDAISRQTLDHAQAAAEAADAKVEWAKKRVAADEIDLSHARILAPVSGRVSRKSVEEGAYVQVGQDLLAIVPSEVWVVANFKETQLTHMRPGQPARIRVDAYPGKDFSGRVESIQSGTGSRFSLLPPENATGNFVKVVQRVPVKIVFDPPPDAGILLAPGMSVEPTVTVR